MVMSRSPLEPHRAFEMVAPLRTGALTNAMTVDVEDYYQVHAFS